MPDDVVDAEVVEDEPGEWVLVGEAAELAGVSRSLIRKWYASDRLPYRKVQGPTGVAYEVPLKRVHELASEHGRSSRSAEVLTHEVARRADVTAEVDRLQAHFDAWTRRLEETWHGLARDLGDARERAGSAEARADAADARARMADEVADMLRVEVERLRQVELEAERLRAQVGERSRSWWKRRNAG